MTWLELKGKIAVIPQVKPCGFRGETIMIGAAVLFLLIVAVGTASALTAQEQLGELLFTDTNLSTPAGQSCQSCHDPAFAFTEPDKTRGVSGGATAGRFGNRNAPSAAYAAFSPEFGFVAGKFAGGQFWDGRATNLTEQAKGPFLNPLEMNNTGQTEVLNKIQAASYASLFNTVCGAQSDQYTCMAAAITAFEKTPLLNKFSSKFDLNPAGLTAQEQNGHTLFIGKGKCEICHKSTIGPFAANPLFTDFTFNNIGVPSNLGMLGDTAALQAYFPFYYPPLAPEFNAAGLNFVDTGLANNPAIPVVLQPSVQGLMKAPTLRNIELTSPYMHNGVFRTLKEVVHFYNTRDVLGNCANTLVPQPGVNCWPAPEVPNNLNKDIGNLGLTDAEENDIVAFLLTLTDSSVSQQGGNITGTVTNATSTAAEPGVSVSAGGVTVLTNAAGFYSISLAAGTYTVNASKVGFTTNTTAGVNVTSGATTKLNIALQPAAPAAQTIGISSFNVPVGGTVTVPIQATAPVSGNIAAVDITLTYDPAVIIIPAGGITSTAFPTVTPNINNTTGTTRIVAASIGGVTGTMTIANVQFSAVGAAGATSPVTITVALDGLKDAAGAVLTPTITNGVATIGGVKGDVNSNGALDVGDGVFTAQAVAGMRTFTPAQTALADANRNGVLDVGDVVFTLQAVAGLRTL